MIHSMIFPLDAQDATLETVGGKGANLAKLARAGFPVPGGFLISTGAYRAFVEANDLGARVQERMIGLQPDNPVALQEVSAEIRAWFAAGALPPALAASLQEAYAPLNNAPVAVRSSATAEDLPDISFAGQQDTFLNVIGQEALLEAVVNCWSSLWTARAIGYRARNDISHADVALAVVVQEMVDSEASGVLFTANPLTGRRAETVIDATLGLGEALVGGHVEPDHYVVDALQGTITRKSLGAKSIRIRAQAGGGVITEEVNAAQQQALPDEQILALTEMGRRVAALYNFPQDIEWAYLSEGGGELYLLQSRPITSLFPIPEEMPPAPLKVMIGFHTVQGIMEPITPLGQDVLKMVLTGGSRVFGREYTRQTQTAFYSAGERLWINVTAIIRHPIGHKIYPDAIKAIDPGVAQVCQDLVQDPRLAPVRLNVRPGALFRVLRFIVPSVGRVFKIWRNPDKKRAQVMAAMDDKVAETEARVSNWQPVVREAEASGIREDKWDAFNQRLAILHETRDIFPDMVIPQGVTAIVSSLVPFFGILERFSRQAAKDSGDPALGHLYLEISRGLPHNVTTEMDLNLWRTAQAIQFDPSSAQTFSKIPAPELAARYLRGELPPIAQQAVAAFIEKYGARGLGEIDIGRPRWREEPTHVMQVIQSYQQITDPTLAPDVVFARGAEVAEEAALRLETAVRKTRAGWFKARLVRWAVRRYRAMAGLREAPKFFAIRMMGIIRQGLLDSGRDFVAAGLLARPDDLFFLSVTELEQIRAQKDIPPEICARITERRAVREREMRRAQIPRVLLSDGQAFYEGVRAPEGEADAIVGDPVSPGVAEGVVRVVFNPHQVQLRLGEILVCPGTDPAWTPLFLAAGGLVMEVGGMMTHGSVVAREYGIPAVVGVHQATTRLQTGQRVRVDGSSGRIVVIDEGEAGKLPQIEHK